MSPSCVIVGAGHGAAQLCASLHSAQWPGEITLVGEEPLLPYHRPPLTKTQLDPDQPLSPQWIRAPEFYHSGRFHLRLGERAEEINREEKFVRTRVGSIPYDHLVLCTGAVPRMPPIPGLDHPRVLSLRNASDAEALRRRLSTAGKAVVIGAGFIGLEVAASLRKLNWEVTILEQADRVLARVTCPAISAHFAALHRARGVELVTNTTVENIRESDNGTMAVRSSTGHVYEGDFVLLGAGALPATRLAEEAGLEVDQGVVVNEFNQTSDPSIFAIGDCCTQWYVPAGRRLRLESVQNAVDQAKTVAGVLAGQPQKHDVLPWFWSDQYDAKLQIAGVSASSDEVVLRGDGVPGQPFSAWYFREGRLRAVDAINDSALYVVATKLLKSGRQPDASLIHNLSMTPKEILTSSKEFTHV